MTTLHLSQEPRIVPKLQAFTYQTEAAEAIKGLEYAAVFHEQGLGKTKIAVDVLLHWLRTQTVDTVLLVVKKGLLANWQRELETHTFMRPRILQLSGSYNYHVFNSPTRLILSHFEAIKKEEERIKLFTQTRSVGVIIDESARLKNPEAALTQSFMALAPYFKRRIIMTGTPIANRPEDIWSQIWFLDQGASLGTDFAYFKSQVKLDKNLANDMQKQKDLQNALEDIGHRISNFTVRETKQSGVIELPNKIIDPIVCDWELTQYGLYQQIRNELKAVVLKDGIPTEEDAEPILKRLLRLVQVASNPRLIDSGYRASPGKMTELADLLYAVHDKNEKAIVWSSFTDNVDWITTELKEFGARRVHGKLGMEARERSIMAFLSDPAVEVLVATPASAKEGLTLTVANHVIFYDRTFSLDDYLQAQDRIHRISQEKTCYVHNLIMPDSIDEWIDVLLSAKHTAAQLAQGDVSPGEFESLMRFDFAEILAGILGTS